MKLRNVYERRAEIEIYRGIRQADLVDPEHIKKRDGDLFWIVAARGSYALAHVRITSVSGTPRDIVRLRNDMTIQPPKGLWPFEAPEPEWRLPHGAFELSLHIDEIVPALGTHLVELSFDPTKRFDFPGLTDGNGNSPDDPGRLHGYLWSQKGIAAARANRR